MEHLIIFVENTFHANFGAVRVFCRMYNIDRFIGIINRTSDDIIIVRILIGFFLEIANLPAKSVGFHSGDNRGIIFQLPDIECQHIHLSVRIERGFPCIYICRAIG